MEQTETILMSGGDVPVLMDFLKSEEDRKFLFWVSNWKSSHLDKGYYELIKYLQKPV